jgi:hypothetical protein
MGGSLQTFRHHGQTFVLGRQGQRYAVVLRNRTAERLEVVVSVDGRDVVHGERSNVSTDRGYLLAPHGMVRIEGFRTSMSTVASFRFTDPHDSFAGRLGDVASLGIVRAAVFREKKQDAIAAPGAKRAPAASRAAPPARRSERRMQPRDQGNLGTQFGESRESRVMSVRFERDGRGVAQTTMLRYDDETGLRARGIEVRPRMERPLPRPRPMPQPMRPRRFTQPPPS